MKIGKKNIELKYTLKSLKYMNEKIGTLEEFNEFYQTYTKNPFDENALEAMLNFVVAGTLSTDPIDIEFIADNLEAHMYGLTIANAIMTFKGVVPQGEEKPAKKPRGRPKKTA